MANTALDFIRNIDERHDPESSIVLRYRRVMTTAEPSKKDQEFEALLESTSIREGVRILPLIEYRGVEIHVMDETSLMCTKTLKSIDGCVTTARCLSEGYDRIGFESGGNTGMAMTRYGRNANLETFFFLPEENLDLLDSRAFNHDDRAHLVSIEHPGATKEAARLFRKLNRLPHIPRVPWRYEASRYRGYFLLEYLLTQSSTFDWISQTISAAFGPIGIYSVLQGFQREIGKVPRFLGIQQKANCPMMRAWHSENGRPTPVPIESTSGLLSRVMYDAMPRTYGTVDDLLGVLRSTAGNLTTIDHEEFSALFEKAIDGKGILDRLSEIDIDITIRNGEIVAKTGLISLAGTLKAIDSGLIAPKSRVLWSLTSGVSDSDGKAAAEFRIPHADNLEAVVSEYSRKVYGGR